MDAVTYPNPEVARYIEDHFIPVQINIQQQPEAMDRFDASWTPTIIMQDANGREHRRSVGYLDPKRILGELALAQLQTAIDQKDFKMAQTLAQEAISLTRGDPSREPEALYWGAVTAYKSSNNAENLTEGWNQLLDRFPQSDWAKRAEFIRQG